MTKKYIITEENAKEIKEYRKQVTDKKTDRRLYAVQLLGEGVKTSVISFKLDADRRQISEWAKKFCTEGGIEGLTKKGGGRYRENMTFEEEEALLNKFKEKADSGQIVTASEIKAEYEKAVGRTSKSHGHIYFILKNHGWKKKMPRSKHPKKASDEAIDASKKLKQK